MIPALLDTRVTGACQARRLLVLAAGGITRRAIYLAAEKTILTLLLRARPRVGGGRVSHILCLRRE